MIDISEIKSLRCFFSHDMVQIMCDTIHVVNNARKFQTANDNFVLLDSR